MSYKHLSLEERYYIEVEQRKGKSANAIGKDLARSTSTVLRQLKRNYG